MLDAADFEIVVAKRFWDKVPPEYVGRTLEKMRRVEQDLLSGGRVAFSRKFSGISAPIYKRRVGQNFRISYQYFNETDRQGINFIAFTSHDAQGRRHRRIPRSSLERMRELSRRLNRPTARKIRMIRPEQALAAFGSGGSYGEPVYAYSDRMFSLLAQYRRECGNAGVAFCNELLHVLDSEQRTAANAIAESVILIGCAGSGKSLVGLRWLQQFRQNGPVLYLTLSKGLCGEIAKKQAEFDHFNEFCLKQDGRQAEMSHAPQFFSLHEWFRRLAGDPAEEKWLEADPGSSLKNFEQWYLGPHNWNKARKAGVKKFTPVDVWGEIRGVIKGHMGPGFLRSRSCPADQRAGKALNFELLAQLGVIAQAGKRWVLAAPGPNLEVSWSGLIINDDRSAEADEIEILEHFRRHLFDEPLLPLELYLDLRDDCSRFDREERELLHALAVEYQTWLEANRRADDSDLARQVLRKLMKPGRAATESFRAMFVDEVQDLTELQIFALIQASAGCRMMFSVDQQQIIHPTYYQTGRLEEALRHSGREASSVILRKNWRCTKELVELQNMYSALRNKEDSLSAEERQPAIASGGSGASAVWIEATAENEEKLLKIGKKHMMRVLYHKNAPDDAGTGLELLKNKGMEFSLALAWKVMEDAEEGWRTIDLDKGRRSQGERSRLCYAMNYFYVAITRARETLLILENSAARGTEWLRLAEEQGLCEHWDTVEGAKLEYMLNQISFEDRLREARQFETLQTPNWEEAAKTYRFIERSDDALRCEAMLAKENKNFDEAVGKFMAMSVIDRNFEDFAESVAACPDESLWMAGRMHQEQVGGQETKGLRGVERIRGEWRRKFPAAQGRFDQAMLQAAQTYPDHVMEAYLTIAAAELRSIRTALRTEIDAAGKKWAERSGAGGGKRT